MIFRLQEDDSKRFSELALTEQGELTYALEYEGLRSSVKFDRFDLRHFQDWCSLALSQKEMQGDSVGVTLFLNGIQLQQRTIQLEPPKLSDSLGS